MNFDEFQEFMKNAGSTTVPPRNPFKSEWKKIRDAIAPHFYGDMPTVLQESFPNEDPEILAYRKSIYQAKTESPVVKATNDLHRLLSSSKHAVYFDNPEFQSWYKTKKIGDNDLFSYFFSVVVPLRILDPNALFIILPTNDSAIDGNAGERIEPEYKIIQSERVIFNDPDYPLIIFEGEKRDKYGRSVEFGINGFYYVITDEFYGKIENGKLFEIYAHNSGKRPWFTLGGRSIPRYDRYDNSFVVYKSDFSPAVPYLNDAAIFDNQHKSVMLSTCFPIKFVDGIHCDTCNGLGYYASESDPDTTDTCSSCRGYGKKLFLSPLAGYNLSPEPMGFGSDKQTKQNDPIRFYSPEIGTITLTGEQADKSLQKAEEVLNINRSIRVAQSGVAKELDREPEYIEVSKISTDLYMKFQHTLEVSQALVYPDSDGDVTVIAPISFDLKSEIELMAEFAETQKGMPADIRYNAYLTFIEQRYANDFEAKRVAEITVAYSSFILYTIAERTEMVAANQITREDSLKSANVFEILMELVNANDIDIKNDDYQSIKQKIDTVIAPKLNSLMIVDVPDLVDDETDNEPDPTLI